MYRQVEESQTLLINTRSKELIAQNKKIIKFGFGQSPFLPPTEVMDALKQAVHHKEYSSVQGELKLREHIANFHLQHNGLKVKPENILLGPGSKILIFNILMAFEQADVFIAAPAWVSYQPQAKLAGHHIIKLNTSFEERWRITPKAIQEATNKKEHEASIMILNHPGNPDGLTYSGMELRAIATACKALDILVISDEIYGLLDFNLSHQSFANFYPEKTITTTGLSKWCGAGGWRFGTAFLYDDIEPAFKQALIGIGSETYSCAPTPIQIAAKVAYQNYTHTLPYLKWQTDILKRIGTFCVERLNAANIKVHSPQGGFYIFLDFSFFTEKLAAANISTSNQLCEQLLERTGVALLPASAFGFEQGFLATRLAFVDFEAPLMESEFDLNQDCPKVVEGIELICNWIAAF